MSVKEFPKYAVNTHPTILLQKEYPKKVIIYNSFHEFKRWLRTVSNIYWASNINMDKNAKTFAKC